MPLNTKEGRKNLDYEKKKFLVCVTGQQASQDLKSRISQVGMGIINVPREKPLIEEYFNMTDKLKPKNFDILADADIFGLNSKANTKDDESDDDRNAASIANENSEWQEKLAKITYDTRKHSDRLNKHCFTSHVATEEELETFFCTIFKKDKTPGKLSVPADIFKSELKKVPLPGEPAGKSDLRKKIESSARGVLLLKAGKGLHATFEESKI
mgnify:CR=1 FL=1